MISINLLLFLSKSVMHYTFCGVGAELRAFHLCDKRNVRVGRWDSAGWRRFLLGSGRPPRCIFPAPPTWPPAAHLARSGSCSRPRLVQSMHTLHVSCPSPVTVSAGPSPQTLTRPSPHTVLLGSGLPVLWPSKSPVA